jgi:hypothetical protein
VARLPTLVVLVALVANAVLLLHFTDKLWFWADDWDLLFRRGIVPGADLGLWAPHNSHWLTAHILVYRALFEVFGLSSFVPYAATEIAFHLATVWVGYLLVRRVGAHPWAAVGAALLLAYFGAGAAAQIFPATMNHVGSLLFGLLAAYVAVRVADPVWASLGAAACLLVCVMFSGTGLSLVVLVALFALTQRGLWFAVRTVAPAAAAFLLWYFQHQGDIAPMGRDTELSQVPRYVWIGLTRTLEDGFGVPGAGPVVVVLLVGALLLARPEQSGLVRLAGSALVSDIVQLVLLSVGRFGFGPEQNGQGHYAYINVALLMPVIALLLHTVLGLTRRSAPALVALGGVLLGAYVVHGWSELTEWHNDFAYLTSGNDDLTLGVRDAHADGEQVLTDVNPEPINSNYRPSYILTPQILDALPSRPAAPAWRLEAESRFFTYAGADDRGLARPGRVEVVSGLEGKADVDKPGCHDFEATDAEPVLEMWSETGNEIVVWSQSTLVKTKLYRDDDEAALREWTVQPGAVHIATTALDTQMLISFNGAGTYQICKQ